jgi:hypothetical protein
MKLFQICTPVLITLTMLSGCATGPQGTSSLSAAPPSVTSLAKVLTYPDRLQPVGADGAQRWKDPAVDFRAYTSILIENVRVKLDADSSAVDPTALKSLTDYFHQSLVKALQPPYAVVDKAGAGVLRVRITLVDLVSTKAEMSVVVLATPYATIPDLVAGSATGGPLGSAPYLGRTGIAADFIDGASNQVVAEFVDLQFGRKYVLDTNKGLNAAVTTGVTDYLDAYSTWAYAKQAFDSWSRQFRQRLDEIKHSTRS